MGAGAAGTWRKPKAALSYGSPVTLVVKNLPDEAKDVRDTGVIPESGRSPGGGHGNTLQCSCLENPRRQRRPAGCSPQGHTEWDTTEALSMYTCPFIETKQCKPGTLLCALLDCILTAEHSPNTDFAATSFDDAYSPREHSMGDNE